MGQTSIDTVGIAPASSHMMQHPENADGWQVLGGAYFANTLTLDSLDTRRCPR